MEWIKTNELIKTIKRFAGKKIEAIIYSGSSIPMSFTWCYDNNKELIVKKNNEFESALTEEETAERFKDAMWLIRPFIFIKEDNERSLAIRILEELVMKGDIDWVIEECGIDFALTCNLCGRLIDVGWWCSETWVFCSEDCMRAVNPRLSEEDWENLYMSNQIEWMEWKSR